MKSLIVACILFGAASTSFAQTPSVTPRPQAQAIIFNCRVAEGPKLEACEPVDPPSIDPKKIANMKATVEGWPSCMVGQAAIGTHVNKRFAFVDTPALMEPPKPGAHLITNPDWAERPSGALLSRFYPRKARAVHASGQAVLHCRVDARGKLQDCTVSDESPPGLGFAEAALSVASEFKMRPKMIDCEPADDGKMNIPIKFPAY